MRSIEASSPLRSYTDLVDTLSSLGAEKCNFFNQERSHYFATKPSVCCASERPDPVGGAGSHHTAVMDSRLEMKRGGSTSGY